MRIDFEGPVGRLEGILWEPEGPPRAAAVFCHPHPLGGGTMQNNVVYRAARGLQEAGLAVLRFNFRSVGRSAGEHDGNGAEDGDLSAALDLMAERYPNLPLWSAGFSFGSRTTCRVAAVEPRIVRIVLVALPVLAYPCDMAHQVTQPGYALMAGEDEYGTLAALEERFPELAARLETHEIPGQSHFFPGALPEVTQRIRAYAEKVLGAGSGSSSTDGTSPPSDS